MTTPLDDLREQVAKRQVVAIVGAGVSIAATGGAETASWIGLLRNGVARCESFGSPPPKPEWGERQRAALREGDMNELLAVGSQIEGRLGAPGGEYRRWLRETVGALTVHEPAVLEALRDLSVPLASTNYDGLIEKVTGLPPVTWRDGAAVQRVIRGDDSVILHLHGYWEKPESVVLGIGSYDQVLGDTHAQTVQSALALMKSFLFIGYGAGLADPNFGRLLRWMRQVFASSEYRHFRLCLDSEREAIQKLHPPDERIFAVAYGSSHKELAPFLQRLKPTTPSPAAHPIASEPAPLPPRPSRIFGREKLVSELVAALLLDVPQPVPVLGGSGFGKSTLCLAALHDPRVAEKFGARRWLVRCDAANTAQDVLKEIALALGLPIAQPLLERVLAALAEATCVLVLDNAETPWETDPLATEALLSQLGGVSYAAMVVVMRGLQRPNGPAWREAITVTTLGPEDSRKAFLAIAGWRLASDRHLLDLIAALDGIPLAIELLAYAAEAEPNLDGLWRRWQDERVALLRRADRATRLVNAAVSFELSINGRRMTDESRQLLSVLAALPDGIAHEDLPAVMSSHSDRAAATLRQVGLTFDEGARLRVLSLVREHVAARHPPASETLATARAYYIDLVRQLGTKVGWEGGDEAVRRLAADARNIEEMLSSSLREPDPVPAIRATTAYGQFLVFSGLGTPHLLEQARHVAGGRDDPQLEASCIERLGDIALARSDHDAARARYEEALALCRKVRNVLGEANCVKRLGDIAFERSDHDAARLRYEEALPLYRKVGGVLGEANCIRSLGDMALARSDHDAARARYEESLRLYERIQEPLSVGYAHQSLARLAKTEADRSHHVAAARQAWQSIKRDDLIRRLDAEFGT